MGLRLSLPIHPPHSNSPCVQVDGLMHSLQSKHEESNSLQLQLADARNSLNLIQASWQGDLAEVQVGRIQVLEAS